MDENLLEELGRAAREISAYRNEVRQGRVTPTARRSEVRSNLSESVPDTCQDTRTLVENMINVARPGLMASAGPRYFGFVVGGSTHASLVADVIATGWDQNGFNEALSPAALAFEDVAGSWLKQLLAIPPQASVGFVTGAQAANTVGIAAARWRVLQDIGWDVGVQGLYEAPRIRIVVGEERHATIDRSLRLLGLGERSLVAISADSDGSMDANALAATLAASTGIPTIVCAQSGNVNTGSFDDLRSIGKIVRDHGAWLHVDGAFGLWAAANSKTRHLVDGIELAHSWGCDGHKWLNVPYDSGYAFCVDEEAHVSAMTYTAAYLTGQVEGRNFGGGDYVPESSRRARGFATWAGIAALGRAGVEDLIERCCRLARYLAKRASAIEGIEVVNDVVLNQVLLRVGNGALTDEIERRIQESGKCWLGATTWRGERLLRVSVSNSNTMEDDIDICISEIQKARDQAISTG